MTGLKSYHLASSKSSICFGLRAWKEKDGGENQELMKQIRAVHDFSTGGQAFPPSEVFH